MKLPLPTADKSLGQHFLKSETVINSICDDHKDVAGSMVEIGPGPGILTEYLAKHELPFHVIEMDERFPKWLTQFISEEQITIQDALTVNLEDFFIEKDISNKDIWLVSNLPYNVSTPLLINFLQAPSIKYMTLMFQREVADKVFTIDTRKGKAMGSLLALSQTYFQCSLLCKVPPGAFQPPPKVDSAVISFKRIEKPNIPLNEFITYEKFLRKAFQMRRKQLKKVLKQHYDPSKLQTAFEINGIPDNVRAEALDLTQVQGLYLSLHRK